MNTENSIRRPKWTARQAISGKTSYWIILSLSLCSLLARLISRVFSAAGCSFGVQAVTAIILIVSGFALAAFLLRAVCNLVFPLHTGELEYLNGRKTRFMWSSTWSFYCGLFMLIAYPMIMVLPIVLIPPIKDAVDNAMAGQSAIAAVASLVVMIGWIVVPIRVSKRINKKMMQKTHPNSEVIEELWAGYHSELIPDKYYNDRDLDGIALILASGRTRSVKTAVRLYSLKTRCNSVLSWVLPIVGIAVAAYVVADYEQKKRDYEIDRLGRSIASHTRRTVIIRR